MNAQPLPLLYLGHVTALGPVELDRNNQPTFRPTQKPDSHTLGSLPSTMILLRADSWHFSITYKVFAVELNLPGGLELHAPPSLGFELAVPSSGSCLRVLIRSQLKCRLLQEVSPKSQTLLIIILTEKFSNLP